MPEQTNKTGKQIESLDYRVVAFKELYSIKEDDSHDGWQDTEEEGEIQEAQCCCINCGREISYGSFCNTQCEFDMYG